MVFDTTVSSRLSEVLVAEPWGWRMSAHECVLFMSVCVCAAGTRRFWWKRQTDWKGEQRAGCVRGVENRFVFFFFFFFINGHRPESHSASLHSTCLISGVIYFNMFDSYKTQCYLSWLVKLPVFKSDFDADNTVLTTICRLLYDDFEGIKKKQ